MIITKLGHCCLLIEHQGKRILTDPGSFTATTHQALCDLDLILITHEHGDHVHTESLRALVAHNPQATVVTNAGVGALLDAAGITYTRLEGDAAAAVAGVPLTAHDGPHAEIYEAVGQVQNTGYFIDDTLFYPGDAYTEPGRPVPILALPVSGPWCAIGDAIRYAKAVAPRHAIPVHDGLLNEAGVAIVHQLVGTTLGAATAFTPLRASETITLDV